MRMWSGPLAGLIPWDHPRADDFGGKPRCVASRLG